MRRQRFLTDPRLFQDRLVKLLGQGTFGKVVEAVEPSSSKRVAIKIIRAIPKYREASTIEIRVLRLLKERDPHNVQLVFLSTSVLLPRY